MNTNALVSAELVIAIQVSRAVVGSDQQVEIAIAIKIAASQSTPDLGLSETAADSTVRIAKSYLAVVAEQLRRLGIADAANVPHRVVNVSVDDRQIKPAIEIGIQKYATESQLIFRGKSDSARGGDVQVISTARCAVEADHLIVKVGDGHARSS